LPLLVSASSSKSRGNFSRRETSPWRSVSRKSSSEQVETSFIHGVRFYKEAVPVYLQIKDGKERCKCFTLQFLIYFMMFSFVWFSDFQLFGSGSLKILHHVNSYDELTFTETEMNFQHFISVSVNV